MWKFIWMSLKAQHSVCVDLCSWLCLHWECLPCKFEKRVCIYCFRMGGDIWDPKATKFGVLEVSSCFPGKLHCVFASALSSPLPRPYAAEGETQVPWCCTGEEKTEIMYPQSKLWSLFSSSTRSSRQKGFQTVECSFSCQQNHISLPSLPLETFF